MASTRRASALALLGIAHAFALGAVGVRAAPATPEDWILARLKTSIVEDGPIAWDAFGPGTFIQFKTEQAPFPGTESRTTLVKREAASLTMRYQNRPLDGEWSKGTERPLARGPVKGAERKVEDLGKETVDVARKAVECTKERWTRVVDGKAKKPELVVWTNAAHALVRWETDLGDGWKSTFTVLRDGVEWKLGDRAFSCREVREVAVSSSMSNTFDRTGLWCPDVPDAVVKQETTNALGSGAAATKQTQSLVLTGFEAKPVGEATK